MEKRKDRGQQQTEAMQGKLKKGNMKLSKPVENSKEELSNKKLNTTFSCYKSQTNLLEILASVKKKILLKGWDTMI